MYAYVCVHLCTKLLHRIFFFSPRSLNRLSFCLVLLFLYIQRGGKGGLLEAFRFLTQKIFSQLDRFPPFFFSFLPFFSFLFFSFFFGSSISSHFESVDSVDVSEAISLATERPELIQRNAGSPQVRCFPNLNAEMTRERTRKSRKRTSFAVRIAYAARFANLYFSSCYERLCMFNIGTFCTKRETRLRIGTVESRYTDR